MRGLLLALLVVAAGCRPRGPSPAECDRLLDRYTELLLRADNPRVSAAEIERHQAETRRRAASHQAFRDCPREVSREQMDCALAAFNPDEIERCLVPVP